MHQLILGASIPLTVALVIYIVRGFRASIGLLILTPLFMGFGAIWAEVPDIPRLIGWYSLYEKMQTPLSNIFFWHYSIDRIEAARLDDMAPLFNAVFALLLFGLLAIAWRELYLSEQQHASATPPTPNKSKQESTLINQNKLQSARKQNGVPEHSTVNREQ